MPTDAATATPSILPRISTPVRLLRFGVVGASGVLVNLGLLTLLVEVLRWHYLAAAALSIEASVLSNYLLNRSWTWADRHKTWWSLLSYHGVTAVGMLTQWLVLLLGVSLLQMHYLTASLGGIGAGTLWNYFANHHVTFAPYTPDRLRRHLRVAMYAVVVLLQLAIAVLLTQGSRVISADADVQPQILHAVVDVGASWTRSLAGTLGPEATTWAALQGLANVLDAVTPAVLAPGAATP